MFNWLTSKFKDRSRVQYPLNPELPLEFFTPKVDYQRTGALNLSPFTAALKLYQSEIGSLPMVTYKEVDGNRERAKSNAAYYLLHHYPNPSMSRSEFWEALIGDYFLRGEFFIQVMWTGNGKPALLLPVPHHAVVDVLLTEEWKKEYHVQTKSGLEIVKHEDMIHVRNFASTTCLRGVSILAYAKQALQLHSQIQESGQQFFENAIRPSGHLEFPGKVTNEASIKLIDSLESRHKGNGNRGKAMLLQDGGKWVKESDTTAEEAKIVEALGLSVADIARWFNLSPLALGDLTRGTYSNLAADKAAVYQRSIRPILDRIELAVNNCLFGAGSDTYAEFLVDAILRGDPQQQADVDCKYVQAGIYLRSEVRAWKNLPAVPGLDQPTTPINMGGTPEETKIIGDANAATQLPAAI